MWQLSIAILVLAGALMASVGTIMNSLPETCRFNELENFGMLVVAIGLVLFGVETWRLWMRENRASKE
jgi:hypothetical protein